MLSLCHLPAVRCEPGGGEHEGACFQQAWVGSPVWVPRGAGCVLRLQDWTSKDTCTLEQSGTEAAPAYSGLQEAALKGWTSLQGATSWDESRSPDEAYFYCKYTPHYHISLEDNRDLSFWDASKGEQGQLLSAPPGHLFTRDF